MSSLTDSAVGMTRFQFARAVSIGSLCLALGLVAAFVYQAGLFQALVPRPVEPGPQAPLAGQTTVSDSRATGFDRENQPYDVNAAAARQDDKSPDRVFLTTVAGIFKRRSGDTFKLTANAGLYNTTAKELDLEGDVTLISEGRFTARMAKAHVVVAEKKLTSNTAVTVDLGSGQIDANGLEITDDGKKILFSNGVRAKFRAKGQLGDGKP
jgi:lipopolysaccharide export system protein LptC